MSNLARIQWDFQEFLLHESGAVHGHIAADGGASVATRLGIYARAYVTRLREALVSNYPAVAKVLGEAAFNELAQEYIASHDSRFFSIRYYGHALAHFVATEPSYKSVPFLADLAQWEWTMAEVFDAADAEPVDAKLLAERPAAEWASLRVTFHPSVRVLPLAWNAPQMWTALMDDAERPRARQERHAVSWLLWRRELREMFRPLSEAEQQALSAARAGESFGGLCDEHAGQAAAWLRDWVDSGLITAIVSPLA
ncbi:MAG TPA: DNA-binding domain-containing protein [Steroidobacteraceae bacterium]